VGLLTRLFRGDDRCLVLLEASVQESHASMQELQALLNSAPSAISIESILQSRDRERAISEEIEEWLCDGTSAPLDHDEIEVLARALDGISRGIKKFATRYQLCARHVQGVSFRSQIERLEQALTTVGQMVAGLRRPKLAATKRLHDALQKAEAEADQLFITLVMDLQKRHHEPIAALMLRDLYELLERVIDRCRTAGNIILRMVLKHT
jgi:uncharacterized protein